ncbi:MAG: hypothetical protein AAF078_09570, partial [Planctomycetota bacterium]
DLIAFIPLDHFDIVLDHTHRDLQAYLRMAISRIDFTTHKQWVLDEFEDRPELLRIVRQQGWIQDARVTLFKRLRDALRTGRAVPGEWLRAVVELEGDTIDSALLAYAMRHEWPGYALEIIEHRPGLDIRPTVSLLWNQRRLDGRASSHQSLMRIAARYGEITALDQLISFAQHAARQRQAGPDAPDDTDSPWRWMIGSPNPEVLLARIVAFQGTPDEVRAWFDENHTRLRFDDAIDKWMLN